jgi:hypothetical protein
MSVAFLQTGHLPSFFSHWVIRAPSKVCPQTVIIIGFPINSWLIGQSKESGISFSSPPPSNFLGAYFWLIFFLS